MPAEPRSPKTLSDWMELDYYRRPRSFRRLWFWSVCGALGVAVLFLAPTLLPSWRTVYEAGPVSTVHAMFNNDCAQCHDHPFETLNRLGRFDASIRAVSDDTCEKCHSGPRHHGDKVLHDLSCAACHREHRGWPSLSRVPDEDCLQCHRDLRRGVKPGEESAYNNVAGFALHPEFQQRWEKAPNDPGTIRFNHQKHLVPEGLLVLDDKQGAALGQTPPDASKQSRKMLQCGDCHQPDEAGRYMKPVRYEQHCRTCHPLAVQVLAPLDAPEGKEAWRQFSKEPAPHRTPETVRAVLRQRLVDFIQGHPAFLQEPDPEQAERPIPGRWPQPSPVTEKEYQWVNKQVAAMEHLLFDAAGGCAYCHREEHKEKRNPNGLPEYARSWINERRFPGLGERHEWFPHSRFRHDSHRLLDCTQCHRNIRTSTETSELHLPGVASCQECHNNRSGAGARADCVECHTYHPAEEKKQFRGQWTVENGKLQKPVESSP
jgi:hypothetical protein